MTKKYTASELLRRACFVAEQSEDDFAECCKKSDPVLCAETLEYVRQLRAYRIKRWGKGQKEKML